MKQRTKAKQLHCETPKFKANSYHQSQPLEINVKTEQLLIQTFSPEKICNKGHEISVLCCLAIEKFNILLECLLHYTHPIVCPKCINNGIQTTVKPNKL